MSRRPLPPLAAIRVFEAAARAKNFTNAAEELGMTQAAVSYQIKLLEERIGAPLFIRHARGVTLSELGQKFAPRTTEALDILADAFAQAQGKSQDTLAISVLPTFASNALAVRLWSFQMANPSLAVRIDISEQIVDLTTGEFDVAIRGGFGDWDGMQSHLILPTSFTPLLSPKLANSIGGVRTPKDLLKLPILDQKDPWWTIWLNAVGLSDKDLPDAPSTNFGPQAVEGHAAIAGQGVGILTPAFFKDALQSGQLIQPFEEFRDNDSGYWLIYPKTRRNSGKIRLFRKWLETEFADVRMQKSQGTGPSQDLSKPNQPNK